MPGGCILHTPFATRISVARAEVALTRIYQSWIGESTCRCSSYQHLRRLLRVGTSVFIATCSCQHKFAEQVRLLLDLNGTGDDIRCVVIRNTIASDGEDVQLHTLALRLDDFPALINPDEIDAVGLQRVHSINTQRHIAKLALATVFLDDQAHY